MIYSFDKFALHPTSRWLRREGRELDVPRKVFDCLAYLIQHRDRAITRDELIEAVWKRNNVSDNQLAHAVAAARRLLDDDGAGQRHIRTVPGFGYHWISAVEVGGDLGDDPVPPPASDSGGQPRPGLPTAAAAESTPSVATAVAAPDHVRPSAAPLAGRPWTKPLSLVLILLTLGLLWWQSRPAIAPNVPTPTVASAPTQTWVLPAELPDDTEAWARIGLMALVAEGLQRQGARIVPTEKVLTRFAELPAESDLPGLVRTLDAAMIVVARAYRIRQTWVVALSAYGSDGSNIRLEASASDLLAAGRIAVQRLNASLKRSGPELVASIEETFELIRQAIRAHDYEGALLQLTRLSAEDRQRPEAGLLEIQLELERGQNSSAREKAELWLQRLDPATQPVPFARMLLANAAALRQLNDEQWPRLVDQAITLLQGADSPRDMAHALQLRGIAAHLAGRATDATRDLMQARDMFAEQGDELRVARVTSTLGQLAMLNGRLREARQLLEQSMPTLEAYGAVKMLRTNVLFTVHLQNALLRWQDALRTTDRLQALQRKGGSEDSFAQSSYLRARTIVLMGLGRLNEAQGLLGEQERATRRNIRENDMKDAGMEDLADLASQRAEIAIGQGRWSDASSTADAGLRMLDKITSSTVPNNVQRMKETLLLLLVQAQVRADPWGSAAPMPVLSPKQIQTLDEAATIEGRVAYAYWNARHDKIEAAEADYRKALEMAKATPQNLNGMLTATDAHIGFLLARKRIQDASQLLDTLLAAASDLPEQSYAAALLILRVRVAQGDTHGAQVAARQVLALVGERQPPSELLPVIEAARKAGTQQQP